jgi:hypothetical protein
MIWLTILILMVVTSLITIFAGNIHGYAGAIVLGMSGVMFDLLWQWLRFKIVTRGKTSHLIGGMIGGLVIRIASVFLFIEIGMLWLGKSSNYFMTFALILLTIPLWSLILAYKFKLERN